MSFTPEFDESVIQIICSELKESGLSMRQKQFVELLETKIQELITSANRRVLYPYNKLTPNEIIIADLIRIGNTSKEIANLLNLSTRTVEVHRNNIRKKLGLINKKVNLRIYLMTH